MEKYSHRGYPSQDRPWIKYYTKEQLQAEPPHMTAYSYMKHCNAHRLDFLAIDSELGNYTYRELLGEIEATADALWHFGVRKGSIILDMLPTLPHESFLFYGVDATGGAMAALAPLYPAEEVCRFIQRFDSRLFFVFGTLLTPEMENLIYDTTGLEHIIVICPLPGQTFDRKTMTWAQFIQGGIGVNRPEVDRDPGDVLLLASTGGSTGEPKSVMLSDDSFNITVSQYINSPHIYSEKDRWLRMWPIFSGAASVANHHLPMCCGMVSVLRNLGADISVFPQFLINERPQHLILIPQIFEIMEHSELLIGQDLSYIKHAGCGGMSITGQFEERVNAFFAAHNIHTFLGYGWGCTESATIGSIRSNYETTRIGTVGVPHPQAIVAAFDRETGKECAYDEEGELCICSRGMMVGYYNSPEMTNNVLRIHEDGRRWLHTGDLGKVDQDGFVTVTGRMTRMIMISANAKIYPTALENLISKVPGVQETAFCAIPHEPADGFFSPVCFIVPETGLEKAEIKAQVNAFCQEQLPRDSRPKHIFLLDSLPLTRMGKPDIMMLEKMAIDLLQQ